MGAGFSLGGWHKSGSYFTVVFWESESLVVEQLN